MTTQTYESLDLQKQLRKRGQFRAAMIERNPVQIVFSEERVTVAGKEVICQLQTNYTQQVDSIIQNAIQETSREHRRTWFEIQESGDPKGFKQYYSDFLRRVQEGLYRAYASSADITVLGFDKGFGYSDQGFSHQTEKVTEEKDREEIKGLLRRKGLEGTIDF